MNYETGLTNAKIKVSEWKEKDLNSYEEEYLNEVLNRVEEKEIKATTKAMGPSQDENSHS